MYQTRQHETELLYTCFASAAAMYRMTCYLGPYIFDPRGGPGLKTNISYIPGWCFTPSSVTAYL